MKGNIMDKKILLSGAAALLLVGNMYATPANASALSLSIGGEASVTFSMSDECADAATGNLADAISLANLNTASGVTYTTGTEATDHATDSGCASGVNEDNPKVGYGKELSIGASGTLANGLEVSFSDTLDLTDVDKEEGSFELAFGGAFGTLTIADGVDSAVKAAAVNSDGDVDVTGTSLGGHTYGTSGTAGVGFLWQAPSVSALDVFVSYSPNSASSGLDSAQWTDTFGVGAVFSADMLTVSLGFESASENTAVACFSSPAAAAIANAADLEATLDKYLGADVCGDESNMAVGVAFDAGDIAINAGWSELDSDEADRTTYNIGASTSLGAYSVGVNYVNATKEYSLGGVEDTQTAISVDAGTSLGDGVDLSMQFSTNDYDYGGAASEQNYYADFKITVAF
jgi:hypothetical protein